MSEDVQTGEEALSERLEFCKLPVWALRHVLRDDDHYRDVVFCNPR